MILSLAGEIEKLFNVKVLMPTRMQTNIDEWRQVYISDTRWQRDEGVRPLGLGAAIASELARLTTLELQTSFGEGEADELMQNFITHLKPIAEYTCALGASLLVPFSTADIPAGEEDINVIHIAAIPATDIYPVAFDTSGRLIGVVISRSARSGNDFYTLLEYRAFDISQKAETVIYRAYRSSVPDYLGTEIPLLETTEFWSGIEGAEYVIKGLEAPLFVYWRMPFALPEDPLNPIGVSCFDNAMSLIEDADRQYSRYLWEYEAGEFAINVDSAALDTSPGNTFKVARLNHRIYRGVEIKDLFKEWNPSLRDSSIYSGLNNILRQIEFRCGLSYGTLSDVQMQEKTATEIINSKQRSYATVSGMQKSLETALRQLYTSLCAMLNIPQAEPVFSWDDSIIVDTLQEKNIFMQEISAGIRAPWEYRVAFLGETEEQAKKAIEEIENSTEPELEFEDEDEEHISNNDEDEDENEEKEEQNEDKEDSNGEEKEEEKDKANKKKKKKEEDKEGDQ